MDFPKLKNIIGPKAKEIIGKTLKGFNGKKARCNHPGHEDKDPSFTWFPDGLKFHCQVCEHNYDIVDYAEEFHKDNKINFLHHLAGLEPPIIELDFKSFHLKPQGKTWLENRGIIGDFGKNVTSDEKFIYYNFFKYKKLVNIKSRYISPIQFKDKNGKIKFKKFSGQIKGSEQLFFMWDEVDKSKDLYLTEGEPDALILKMLGYNVSSYGSAGSGALIKKYLSELKEFPKVIFICDNDNAGKKRYEILENIALKNAHKVISGNNKKIKDINDLYEIENKQGIEKLFDRIVKCCGYEKQLLKKQEEYNEQKSELIIELENHLKNCNNIYRTPKEKYIVTQTKNSYFTSKKPLEIISASGLNITRLQQKYKGALSLINSVFSDHSHLFPVCMGEGYSLIHEHGEMFSNSYGENFINCYKNKGLYQSINADKKIHQNDFPIILKHFKHMYGENYEFVLKILAWNLQNPGIPSKVVIVHSSGQGTGKGLISQLWCNIFRDFTRITQTIFESDFNDFMKRKIIIAEEVSIHKKNHADKLKAFSTEPTISLNLKGQQHIEVRNFTQWIINTNRSIPVFTENDDRRLFICTQEKLEDDGFIDELLEIYYHEKGHDEVINLIKYCKAMKVSRIDLKIPDSEIKEAIILNSKSQISEVFEDLDNDFMEELSHIIESKLFKREYFQSLKNKCNNCIERYNEIRITMNDFKEVAMAKLGTKTLKKATIYRHVKSDCQNIVRIDKKNGARILDKKAKAGFIISLEHIKEKQVPKPDIKKAEILTFPEEKKIDYQVEGATYVNKKPESQPLFGPDFDPTGWEKTEHQFDGSDEE